ncbi:MAG: aldehyde dehydrogenase family protein [Syntrophaceae bacterium]|nr:aldehyde dehydrogenase family protein [Syntrophaceae bacterium]
MTKDIKQMIDKLTIEKRAFIDGSFVKSVNGKTIRKVSPVDGTNLSGLCACCARDINKAVAAAKKSFESKIWRNKQTEEKKEILFKLADLMEQNRERLALLDTVETGRAFKNYFYDSIPKAFEALRYFTESLDKYYDYAMPPKNNSFAVITREPLGVVGIITPWNDPLVVSTWKFAPALLMGNSVVIKPAEQSSFSILEVARLAKQAGIPDGVFNVVPGYGEIAGKALAMHKDVAGIFFTGSSEVGKMILQYAGQSNIKKVGLECGGKSPFIISKKCNDLKRAASVLAKNIFYNQGQICSAPSRVIVHHELKRKLIDYLKSESVKYIPDDPMNINSDVGCVVSKQQKDKIERYIKQGIKTGATLITPPPNKWFSTKKRMAVLPSIFTDVDLDSSIVKEEIFGPVLVVIGFDTIQEAIDIANHSRYGLAASIWTDDLKEAYYVSRNLQAGIVHVNGYGNDDNTAPFGGIKESGIGKDKSIFAFDEYSYLKTTWIDFSHR